MQLNCSLNTQRRYCIIITITSNVIMKVKIALANKQNTDTRQIRPPTDELASTNQRSVSLIYIFLRKQRRIKTKKKRKKIGE